MRLMSKVLTSRWRELAAWIGTESTNWLTTGCEPRMSSVPWLTILATPRMDTSFAFGPR